MHITLRRVEIQKSRIEKTLKILWRLYTPFIEHQILIIEAAYRLLEAYKAIDELYKRVMKDTDKIIKASSRIPPGYEKVEKKEEKQIIKDSESNSQTQ